MREPYARVRARLGCVEERRGGSRKRTAGLRRLRTEAAQAIYTPLTLDVLTLEGARAAGVTAFVAQDTRGPARERYAVEVFGQFGLPDRLQ